MDYHKKITLSIISISVLSLTAFLGLIFSPQFVVQRQSNVPLLEGFSSDSITKIVIENQATLARTEGTWKVMVGDRSYPASQETIQSFLKNLSSARKIREVSSSGKDLDAYGLDKDYKHVMIHEGSSKIFDLLVGKVDSGGKYCYVKLADQDRIWATDRQFSYPLNLEFSTWTDLSLIPGQRKPDDLVRVSWSGSLTNSSKEIFKSFELHKTVKGQTMKWQLKGSEEFPSNAVSYVEQLLKFTAYAYMKPDEFFDPNTAAVVLTLEWSNGEKTEVRLGSLHDKRFPVAEGDRLLWINEWALNTLVFKPQKEDSDNHQ